MIHARNDYDAIQDGRSEGAIPSGEPVFLLRAKDKLAPDIVREWSDMLEDAGGDPATIEAARMHAVAMEDYALEYYGGGKVPDAPEEVL